MLRTPTSSPTYLLCDQNRTLKIPYNLYRPSSYWTLIARIFSQMGDKSEPNARRHKTSCPSNYLGVTAIIAKSIKGLITLTFHSTFRNVLFFLPNGKLPLPSRFLLLRVGSYGSYTQISLFHRETNCWYFHQCSFGTTRNRSLWRGRAFAQLFITSSFRFLLLRHD